MCSSSSKDFMKHLQTSYWSPMLTFQTPIYTSPNSWHLENFSDMQSHLLNEISLFHCWNVPGEPKYIYFLNNELKLASLQHLLVGSSFAFWNSPERVDLVSYMTVQTCLAVTCPCFLTHFHSLSPNLFCEYFLPYFHNSMPPQFDTKNL